MRIRTKFLAAIVPLLFSCSGDDGGSDTGASTSGSGTDSTSNGGSTGTTDATTGSASGTGGTSGSGGTDTAASDSAGTTGEDIKVWEMRMDGFSPPTLAGATWYGCEAWTFTVPAPVHIVGFRPQVSDPHVHHYVVEMFDTAVNADPIVPCVESPFNEMVWGWAPGGEDLMLPDDVGMRAGETGVVSFRVQVHYNNPLADNFSDNGGFDVLYTETLRTHDAGIFTTGAVSGDTVPAGDPAYEHMTPCDSPLTGSEPANIIGYWLHAHEIGSTLWTDLLKSGGGTEELGRADPFSFDKQTFEPLTTTINPGDTLETHCIYDATDRTGPTDFGEATSDEMCINFLLYYPDGAMPADCGNL